MIELVWILGGLSAIIFVAVILGAVGAGIYDAWYQRKYAVWLALQEDHNRPKRPLAK